VPTVADVVRRYGADYLQRFGDAMPVQHQKVLAALAACRTGELGTVVFACSACGQRHHIGRSCGNRHCPSCQHDKTRAWLHKQSDRLLPTSYFLVTFTLPAELRDLVRSHQRFGYDALLGSSSEALRLLAADPKFVGTLCPGFSAILHTWGRTLSYHPHVHFIVAGGGPSQDGSQWLASKANFYAPDHALSRLFRAKFRDALQQAGLLARVDPCVWTKNWVVHSKAVGDGRAALHYLSAHVFRVAISDQRIRSYDNGQVTFTYRKSGSRRWRSMTLDAHEFLRRFLQHALPTGFQKVRHYGFLSPNARHSLQHLRWLATLHAGQTFVLDTHKRPLASQPLRRCADCGAPIFVVGFRFAGPVPFDTS
jgi:hypothetical protein